MHLAIELSVIELPNENKLCIGEPPRIAFKVLKGFQPPRARRVVGESTRYSFAEKHRTHHRNRSYVR